MRSLTHEQVADVGRCQALLPTEAQFVGKKGYKRKYRADGTYEWRYRYTTNHKGKLTREANEVLEMMRPFSKADTDRHSALEQKKPRVALKSRDGAIQFVEPALADRTARQNGWTHVWRARGNRVERGPDSMLFRCVGGEWEALGVHCLGTPLWGSATVPRRGVQHDPDGRPWRWIAGSWRRVA